MRVCSPEIEVLVGAKWLILAILTTLGAVKRRETAVFARKWRFLAIFDYFWAQKWLKTARNVRVRVKHEISFPTVQTECLYDAYKPRELPKCSFWRVDFGARNSIYISICRFWLDDVVDGRDLPFPKLSLDVPKDQRLSSSRINSKMNFTKHFNSGN